MDDNQIDKIKVTFSMEELNWKQHSDTSSYSEEQLAISEGYTSAFSHISVEPETNVVAVTDKEQLSQAERRFDLLFTTLENQNNNAQTQFSDEQGSNEEGHSPVISRMTRASDVDIVFDDEQSSLHERHTTAFPGNSKTCTEKLQSVFNDEWVARSKRHTNVLSNDLLIYSDDVKTVFSEEQLNKYAMSTEGFPNNSLGHRNYVVTTLQEEQLLRCQANTTVFSENSVKHTSHAEMVFKDIQLVSCGKSNTWYLDGSITYSNNVVLTTFHENLLDR